MTHKAPRLHVDDAIRLYETGSTTTELQERFGAGIYFHLRKAGVLRSQCDARRLAGRQRRDAIRSDVVNRFDAGQSVKAIAVALNIQRSTVSLCLADAGISPRNRSEAMLQRMANTPPDERERLTRRAHDAVRGMKRTPEEMAQRAVTKQATGSKIGRGERELAEMLKARGVHAHMQYAFGPYNIDIMCGLIAVEVHSQVGYPHAKPAVRKRIEYLLDAGLNVVYVLCARQSRGRHVLTAPDAAAADDIAAFFQRTQSDPTVRRQYRVIRRTGELVATCCGDLDKIALVPVPRRAGDGA